MPENQNVTKLYDTLTKEGFNLPDYTEFESSLKDEAVTERLYTQLNGSGFRLPTIDEFKSSVGSPNTRNSADFIYEQLFEDIIPERERKIKEIQNSHKGFVDKKKPVTDDKGASFADYQEYLSKRQLAASDELVNLHKDLSKQSEADLQRLAGDMRKKDAEELNNIEDSQARESRKNELANTFNNRYEKKRREYFNQLINSYAKQSEETIDAEIRKNGLDQRIMDLVFKRFDKDDFKEADIETKEDIMELSWYTYANKSGLYDKVKDPQQLKEYKDEYMYHLARKVYIDEGPTNPSIAGMKSLFTDMAQSIAEELETPEMKAIANANIMTSNIDGKSYMPGEVIEDSKGYSFQDQQKYNRLQATQRIIDDIMRVPETKEETWKEVWKGLANEQFYDKAPFIGSLLNIESLARVNRAHKKMKEGKKLQPSEEALLQAFGALHQTSEMQPKSTAFNVGKGVAAMLPYIGEFAATMGAFTGTKKAAETGITKLVEAGLKKNIKEAGKKFGAKSLGKKLGAETGYELATKTMAYSIGALAQTSVNPQQYVNNTLERMAPQVSLSLSEAGANMVTEIQKNGEPFGEAFSKGFGMAYAEFFTEMLGPKLMGTTGYLMNKATGGAGDQAVKYLAGNDEWFKRIILGGWMKKRGILTQDQAIKSIMHEKLGWSGIIEEYLEEFANARMSDLITGDNQKAKTRIGALLPHNYNWQQEFETFLTVGLFGLPMTVVRTVSTATEGENTKVTFTDKKSGAKKSVTLPKSLVSMAIASAHGKAGIVEQFSEKLMNNEITSEQYSALAIIAENERQKNIPKPESTTQPVKEKKDEKESKGKAEKVDEKEKVEPEDETTKKTSQTTQIEVPSELKPLQDAGVLLKDKEGKLIKPTPEQIDQQIDELQIRLGKEEDKDKIGQIHEKLEVLAQYRETIQPKKESESKEPTKIDNDVKWWNGLNERQKMNMDFIQDRNRRGLEKAVKEGRLKKVMGQDKEGNSYVDRYESIEEQSETDKLVDQARAGDKKAQETLEEYGLPYKEKPIYRFISEEEKEALEKGELIEGRFKNTGVDITTDTEQGEVPHSARGKKVYRVKFKKSNRTDYAKEGTDVKFKNEKEGWLGKGYTLEDVESIEDVTPEQKPKQGELEFQGEVEKQKPVKQKKKPTKKKEAPERPTEKDEPRLHREWIAKHSQDPNEIHQAWQEEQQEAETKELTPLEDFVVNLMGRISGSKKKGSFQNIHDKNDDPRIQLNYFSKTGRTIDSALEEARNMKGIPESTTLEDIIDIIIKFPTRTKKSVTQLQVDLEKRYKDLTGRKIQDKQDLSKVSLRVEDKFQDWVNEVDPFSPNFDKPIEFYEEYKDKVPKESKEEFEKYIQSLKQARTEIFEEEPAPDIEKAETPENAPEIIPKYKNKIIYVSPGLGKEELAGRSDIKDGDDILREVLRDLGVDDPRIDTENVGMVGFKYENQPEIANAFKEKAKQYKAQGYTVITANNFARDPAFVDEVLLASDPLRIGALIGEDSGQSKFEKEQKSFAKKAFRSVTENETVESVITSEPKQEKPQMPGLDLSAEAFFESFRSEKPKTDEELKQQMQDAVSGMKRAISKGIDKYGNKQPNLLPSDDESYRKEFLKNLQAFIDAAIKRGFNTLKSMRNELIRLIRKGNTIYEQAEYLRLFDENARIIENYIKAVEAVKDGKLQAKVSLNMIYDNPEGVMRVAGGIDPLLKTFSGIWEAVSNSVDISREFVEQTFFNFAKSGSFNDIRNEQDYEKFLIALSKLYENPQRDAGKVMKELIDQLKGMSYSQAISLFNLYGSMEIVERIGQFIGSKGIEYKTLNQSEHYHNFINTVKKTLKEKGIKNIQSAIRAYESEKKKRFGMVGLNPAGYNQLSAEERYEKRVEQFNADLQLLEDITGIKAHQWEEYFKPITRETTDHLYVRTKETGPGIKKDPGTSWNLKPVSFDSYQDLLKEDIRRFPPGSKKSYIQINTNFVLQLVLKGIHQESNEAKAKSKFIQYFLADPVGVAALNNIYKLATAMPDTVGLSGRGMTGSRFSSFVRYSDMMQRTRNFAHLVNNMVAQKYKGKARIPIKEFAGINNKVVIKEAKDMTMDELWTSMVTMFFESKGEYNQVLSQFGDKEVINLVPVPKYDTVDIEWIKKNWNETDFKKSVEFLANIIFANSISNRSPLKKFHGKSVSIESSRKLAEKFAFNWARNITDLTEIFFGDKTQYNSDIDLVKRGGSSNSPGYLLNPNVEGGVGRSFRHLDIAEWEVPDELGLAPEVFDGALFMSGKMAQKMKVNMGDVFAREFEHGTILDSVKALYSIVKENGTRGLTKANFLNIDILAEAFKDAPEGQIFVQIKELLDSKELDTLSFTKSGTKLLEEKEKSSELITKDGKVDQSKFSEDNVINRDTQHIFIQQDLRHSMMPQLKKMSVQFVSNILGLPNGLDILKNIVELQIDMIDGVAQELRDKDIVDWLKEYLDEENHRDLLDILEEGADITEPAASKLIRQMLASDFNKRALEIPVNRVMAQEIPSIPGLLKGYERIGDKVLPAQVAVGIAGLRYAEKKGSKQEAMDHVRKFKDKYLDLFNEDGSLREWEFRDDGLIPGEPVIVTRIPADDLHSHTYGRATYKIRANFVMLDKESQARSGSDYDGDQRSIQVLNKSPKGRIIKGNSRRALANKILFGFGEEYSDPVNLSKIMAPIDTKAYDDTVKELRKGEEEKNIDLRSIEGFDLIRRRNIAGVKMKSIMSNITSLFSYAKAFGLKLKQNMKLDDIDIHVSTISKDHFNRVKVHIGNLLNMSFDNAKDPKIDTLGLTPDTANLYAMLLMFNKRIDQAKTPEEADRIITNEIDKISKFMNSDYVKYILQEQENARNAYTDRTESEIEERAIKRFKDKARQIKQYISFQSVAAQISMLKIYQGLMHEAPKTSAEYIRARNIHSMVVNNKFKNIDVTGFQPQADSPFESITRVLEEIYTTVLSDLPEFSNAGEQIIGYIRSKYKADSKGAIDFNRAHLDKVIRLINQIAAIKSIDQEGLGFPALKEKVLTQFKELQSEDNLFFDYVSISEEGDNKVPTIILKQSIRFSKIPEYVLDDIREDFAKLPEDFKMNLALYGFYMFGPAISTFNGNFYNLYDNKFRAGLSHKLRSEFSRWESGLDNVEKYTIAEWVLRSMNSLDPQKEIIESDFVKAIKAQYNNSVYDIMDINQSPNTGYLLNTEALDDMAAGRIDELEMQDLLKEFGSDVSAWLGLLASNDPKYKGKSAQEIALMYVENLEEIADSIFNPPEVKNHIPQGAEEEMLLTEDQALSDYIFENLRKHYPGLRIFESREAFEAFAEKLIPMGLNIDPRAVGHALANAIYIDPTKAFQSTPIHELGHIYWETLPDDNKVKKAIREHFMSAGMNPEQAEEAAMNAIGFAGVKELKQHMTGTWWNRFKELLKRFWRDVKIAIGKAKPSDYINRMAHDVLVNRHNIDMSSDIGPKTIKNSIKDGLRRDKDGKPMLFHVGDVLTESVTKFIESLKTHPFDPFQAAEKKAFLNAAEFKETYKIEKYQSEISKDRDELIAKWEHDAHNGTSVHEIISSAFDPNVKISSKARGQFSSEKAYNDFINNAKEVVAEYKKRYPDGTKFHVEIEIGSELGLTGRIDLLIEKPNGHFDIVEFKTGDTEWIDSQGNEHPSYDKPYGNWKTDILTPRKVSKKKGHGMQLNIYANIIDEQFGGKEQMVDNIYVHQIILKTAPSTDSNIKEKIAGKISNAKFSEQQIDLKRNFAIFPKIKSIIVQFTKGVKQRSARLTEYKQALLNEGVFPVIAERMAEAIKYFQSINFNKPLQAIQLEDIEKLTGTGWDIVEYDLRFNGFTEEQLGNMNTEARFYAYLTGRKPNEMFEQDGKTLNKALFKDFIVRKRIVRKKKPTGEKSNEISHIKIGEENIYVQNTGLSLINVGDEIVELYPFEAASGKLEYHPRRFKLEAKRKKSILLVNVDTSERLFIPINEANPYFGKVVDKPKTKVKDNSYRSQYQIEIQETKRQHYNLAVIANESKFSSKDQERNLRQARVIWNFFDRYDTPEKMMAMLRDKAELDSEYNKLRIVDDIVLGGLAGFLQDQLMNHIMQETIRTESKLFERNKIMPLSLHLYETMANPEQAFNDFSGFGTRWFTPTRLIRQQHHALNFFTMQTKAKIKNSLFETINFQDQINRIKDKASKYGNSLDPANIVEVRNGVLSYKNPKDESLSAYEKDYLQIIYAAFTKYHPDYLNSFTPASIPVPKIYFLRTEAKKIFGKYGARIHDLLSPSVHDNVKLEIEGPGGTIILKSLRQLKNEYADQHLDIEDWESGVASVKNIEKAEQIFGSRIGNIMSYLFWRRKRFITSNQMKKWILEAEDIYKKGGNINNKDLKKKIERLPVSGNANTQLISMRVMEITGKVITELIERKHLSEVIPLYESFKNKYNENSDILRYLIDTYKITVLKLNPGVNTDYADETYKNVTEFLLRLNSYRKISFSVAVQKANFLIGQFSDIIRDSGAYAVGLKRIHERGPKSFKKAFKIAVRAGLANLRSEEEYQNLNETGLEKAVSWGYWPMDKVEKMNQLPLFIGNMTQEEWDSFNDEGEIIDNRYAPDAYRLAELEEKVQEVHGDYTRSAAAPGWFTPIGRFGAQFAKYIPAVLDVHLAGHHIGQRHEIRAGMWRSMELLGRLALYRTNVFGFKEKVLRNAAIREEYDKGKFNNTREYFGHVMKAIENNDIVWKTPITITDKKNYKRLITELILVSLAAAAKFGPDDDDSFLKRTADRLLEDLLLYIAPEFFVHRIKSPAPILSLPEDIVTFGRNLISQSTYQRDVGYALKGWKKFWFSAIKLAPGGNAMRELMTLGVQGFLMSKKGIGPDGEKMNMRKVRKLEQEFDNMVDIQGRIGIENPEEYLRGIREWTLAKEYGKIKRDEAESVAKAFYVLAETEKMKNDPEYRREYKKAKKLLKEEGEEKKDVSKKSDRKIKKLFESN